MESVRRPFGSPRGGVEPTHHLARHTRTGPFIPYEIVKSQRRARRPQTDPVPAEMARTKIERKIRKVKQTAMFSPTPKRATAACRLPPESPRETPRYKFRGPPLLCNRPSYCDKAEAGIGQQCSDGQFILNGGNGFPFVTFVITRPLIVPWSTCAVRPPCCWLCGRLPFSLGRERSQPPKRMPPC